jgi:WD repeat and SOF domain-containing protein 1
VLASTGNDRSICLYDTRMDSPLRKVMLAMCSNSLAWNPREPFNFTVANEDHNCYTFDMRKLQSALMVHKDHVGAVMDVSYSPTGKEFATASYDKMVRIFRTDQGKSREVYHTKRMQRVFTVRFSGDAKFVLTGSDDTNVRIWKAQASAPLGRQLPRERAKLDYLDTLKKRYAHMPEVRRIANFRHVPQGILKKKREKLAEEQRARRKLDNVRAHTAPGSREGIPDAVRTKRIAGVVK